MLSTELSDSLSLIPLLLMEEVRLRFTSDMRLVVTHPDSLLLEDIRSLSDES
jgi:hypothetical protein